jgi:undecaprenyl-diphosphatase
MVQQLGVFLSSRRGVVRRGVVLANPKAGSRSTAMEQLREAFDRDGLDVWVEECDPSQLLHRLDTILDPQDGPSNLDFVGIAGGDGSIRCGVESLLSHRASMPLLVVPTGTRNHFARDLGIDDVTDAAAAAASGHVRDVDVASVNGLWFVNNSSIGAYPQLVAKRENREDRMPKPIATVVGAWHLLRDAKKLRVRVDGSFETVWLVFVGNDCYGESVTDLSGRERLDDGTLDVRVARAEGRLSRLRITCAVLFGRLLHSPLIERRECAAVVLDTRGVVDVALDGEVVTMQSPLEYRSRPARLSVLAPPV